MSVTLRDAQKLLWWNMLAGITTMLESPPGFGKSELMVKLAAKFKAYHPGKRVGIASFFMATQSPIGFTGLPWKGTRTWRDPFTNLSVEYTVTDPAIPQWFMARDLETGEIAPASLFDHVLLVVEEWGQGGPDTKKAGAEVLRAGGTPPYYLPEGSWIVALSNADPRDGVTKEFDFVVNRVQKLPLHGDAQIWVDDFADHPYRWSGKDWRVSSFSKSYVLQHGKENELFEPKPEKQGPWCSPRSYTNMDRLIQVATKENGGVVPVDSSLLIEGMTGLVGMGVTTGYMAQMQFAIKLPSYDAVVAAPDSVEVPKQVDLQMLMAYELAARAQPDDLPAIFAYIKRLADGMNTVFVGSLLRKDYKRMINEPAMKAWISKNAALVTVVSSLAQGM